MIVSLFHNIFFKNTDNKFFIQKFLIYFLSSISLFIFLLHFLSPLCKPKYESNYNILFKIKRVDVIIIYSYQLQDESDYNILYLTER